MKDEILPKQVAQGDWLRVPYQGDPFDLIEIQLKEWKPCYHDSGDVMIRAHVPQGKYSVKLRKNKTEQLFLGYIEVV